MRFLRVPAFDRAHHGAMGHSCGNGLAVFALIGALLLQHQVKPGRQDRDRYNKRRQAGADQPCYGLRRTPRLLRNEARVAWAKPRPRRDRKMSAHAR
jgi:hypothetical protein